VTKRFLRANGLRLLVRSHQVPHDGRGYEWWHKSSCLTIFSASNYCGEVGNLGAVLLLAEGEDEQLVEHYAPTIPELLLMEAESCSAQDRIKRQAACQKQHRLMRRSASEKMLQEVTRQVQELVVKHKTDLFEYWSDVDTSPRGVFQIPANLWREGCAAILDTSLPWVRLQEAMGVADECGLVHYVNFLTRFRVAFTASYGISAAGWQRAAWCQLMDMLLKADLPLREALAALDPTNDGLVSGVEFAQLLQNCHIGISALRARALLRSVAVHARHQSGTSDSGWDSRAPTVSVWELLGRLQVTLPVSRIKPVDPDMESWAIERLRPLAVAVLADARERFAQTTKHSHAEWPVPKLLAAWFEDVDSDRNGFLEYNEFISALQQIGPALSRAGCPADTASLTKLATYCDVSESGHINYYELLNGLTWQDSLGLELQQDMAESVNAAIYFHMVPVERALRGFDIRSTGHVSPEHFTAALRAVTTAVGSNTGALSRTEISSLVEHLPQHDGLVNYENFLRSFRIVDTLTETRRERVLEAFRQFDQNGDGTFHLADMRRILPMLDPVAWTLENVDSLFKSLGASSGNGAVDYEHFVDWIFSAEGEPEQQRLCQTLQL